MSKKILIYSTFLITGGIERVLIEYIKMLKDNNIDVDILIDYDLGITGNTLIEEIPTGIKYSFVKGEKISKLIYLCRTLGKKYKIFNLFLYGLVLISDFIYYHVKVKKICKQGNYTNIIVFFQLMPAYVTTLKGINTSIWLHGSVKNGILKGILGKFKGAFFNKINKFDNIITIANEMKEELLEVYPYLSKEKVKVIYNPINGDDILAKSLDPSTLSDTERELIQTQYICHVSRVDENQKDITTLIQAYSRLKEENKIAHKLYIIGNGTSKKDLANMVHALDLQKDILFLGNKNNPYIWMKNSSVVILSTKYEGLPTVLLEAMVLGIPVLSSRCKTGPAEILQDGKCGLLNEVGNYEQLSQNIYKVLNDKTVRDSLVQNANERIKDFTPQQVWSCFADNILK